MIYSSKKASTEALVSYPATGSYVSFSYTDGGTVTSHSLGRDFDRSTLPCITDMSSAYLERI